MRFTRPLLLSLLAAGPASAICDVIPGATNTFRAATGTTDRPFAMPGDVMELRVRPAVCDGESIGFVDLPGGATLADDYHVTVLFEPPGGGAKSAVVVTTSDCATLTSALSACEAQLGAGGTASCRQAADASDLSVFPDPIESRLRFRFPDTDSLVGTPTDDRTLAGPATLAATGKALPLPCDLAGPPRCAERTGLVACVDELYEMDGSCGTAAGQVDSTFGHFVALPPPNNYEAVCDTPGTPCDGTATEIRFTTDAAGNVLAPMDYRGVLVRLDDVPVPRLARGDITIPAFSGSPDSAQIPSEAFLSSWSPKGHRVPPIFTPLTDPANPTATTLFGSVDAPMGVIRIARRACLGGSGEGLSCTSDADCPGLGATCSAALFDFTDRYASGVGPVLIPDTQYAVAAENPVPLDGLVETEDAFAFSVAEGIANQDLNGDGDQLDQVVTLRDRQSGAVLPIGDGGAPGRAVVRVRQGRFAFPAVEASGDLVGFLESEPNQGNTDTNGNGNVFDSILRVFRLGAGAVTSITPVPAPTIDASTLIDGGSLAFAGSTSLLFVTAEGREAQQETLMASGGSFYGAITPSLSADGRFVAFISISALAPPCGDGLGNVHVRDAETGVTTCVSADSTGGAADSPSFNPKISAGGRFVAFTSVASDLVVGGSNGRQQAFVHDRQTGQTTRISVSPTGDLGNHHSNAWSLSADGRFVAFESVSTNLVPDNDTNATWDIFVRDRQTDQTTRVSVSSSGELGNASSNDPVISADGRFVAFWGYASNLVSDDTNSTSDVFVHDRQTGQTSRVSVGFGGSQGDSISSNPSVSADGRFVAFQSASSNLVPGDTDGSFDVFVHDRHTHQTVLASQGGDAGTPVISGDGRLVAFEVSGQILTHDLRTGATAWASVDSSGSPGNDQSLRPAISADGRFVAFYSRATNLGAGSNNEEQVFVRGPVPSDLSADHTGDGAIDDTAMRVVDVSAGPPAGIEDLCPAAEAAVAGSRVGFLRPESAGPVATVSCSQPNADLNADGDTNDQIVQERTAAGAIVSHARAARAIAASDTALAALVSEADQGGQLLNGDGDAEDLVLAVHTGASGWSSTGMAGDALAIFGSLVAVAAPEAGQGADLNTDGDFADRVLHVADASGGATANTGQSVVDFVAGEGFVAFRTGECDEGGAELDGCASGGTDLNGDGDAADAVLQVWVSTGAATGFVHNTGSAALACEFEACDPRFPYRVVGSTVTFLTLECQQGGAETTECAGGGTDLNGDGDAGDLVLQVVNVNKIEPPEGMLLLASFSEEAGPLALGASEDPTQSVAATSAGVCTSTGAPCAFNSECGTGSCFVPPGQCVIDLGTACSPSSPGACGPGKFCRSRLSNPSQFTCHQGQGACKSTSECTAPAQCLEADQQLQRVVAPVASAAVAGGAASGAQVFASTGTCVETLAASCSVSADCEAGEYCADGTCRRDHGACETDADCTAGSCTKDLLITATAADSDGDGLADPLDVCPEAVDPAQADADGDGIGDACDASTCSNGALETGEECDDGNLEAGDACDASCQKELPDCSDGVDDDGDTLVDLADLGCGGVASATKENPQCSNGADDDGDGVIDLADPGCQNAADDSENSPPACADGLDNDTDGAIDYPADTGCTSALDTSERQTGGPTCDDGADNDSDGFTDYPADPACRYPSSTSEQTQCQDGLDNDGDGKRDYDGGASRGVVPPTAPDPQCTAAWVNKEAAATGGGGCGVGPELILLIPLLGVLRRRARNPFHSL